MANWLSSVLKYEPVLLAWVLNGGLAVLLGNVIHISSTQEAAVTTIATAAVAIYTAWETRPVAVAAFVGALSTAAVAAGAFGLHFSNAEIGAGAAVLSGVLALILRQNVSSAAAVREANPPAPALVNK
jgi:hypothetical protein